MFDILVSKWCGKQIPLSTGVVMGASFRLRDLRTELIDSTSVVSTTVVIPRLVSAGQTAVMQTEGPESETGLAVHRNKLVAMTFWYEVRPPSPI